MGRESAPASPFCLSREMIERGGERGRKERKGWLPATGEAGVADVARRLAPLRHLTTASLRSARAGLCRSG